MSHTILTFITRVRPEKVDELDLLLKQIADNLLENPYLPFPALKLPHFMSLVLHNDTTYGFGPYLIFENNFDGPLDPYLDELYQHAADGLHRIYSCCIGYQAASPADREQMLGYLRAHVVRPNAYHIGNVGRSAERIRQEAGLRDRLEDFADTLGSDATPDKIRSMIQQFVQNDPALAWVARVKPRQTHVEKIIPYLNFGGVIGLAIVLLIAFWWIVIPLLLLYLTVLWWKEAHDETWSGDADHDHVQELTLREDRTHSVQNHMASIAIVKPGLFRRLTLWAVLAVVNLKARTSTNGQLSGIPSIHFAHWSMIDGGRRLESVMHF